VLVTRRPAPEAAAPILMFKTVPVVVMLAPPPPKVRAVWADRVDQFQVWAKLRESMVLVVVAAVRADMAEDPDPHEPHIIVVALEVRHCPSDPLAILVELVPL